MSGALKLEFAPLATPAKGVLVLFCEDGLKFGSAALRAIKPTGDLVTRAAAADRFKGKNGSALDIVAPLGLEATRLVVVGVGKARDLKTRDFVKLGGAVMGRIPAAAGEVTILVDLPGGLAEAGSGRRSRARRSTARLYLRSVQNQAQGRGGAAGTGQGHDRGRGRRGGREGVRAAPRGWRWGRDCARSGQ